MTYAQGKHTQFNNDRKVHPEIWNEQHGQCLNDDSISNKLRMKLSPNNLQAPGLLEVLTSHIIVKWLCPGQKQHGDQDMNGDGQKYYYIKNY